MKMKKQNINKIVILGAISVMTLAGCGGGGGSSSTSSTSQDTLAPVVTLNGKSEVSVTQFFSYEEAGATAVDNKDGNVAVDISGAVDTQTPNVYIVTYIARDLSGNTGKAERYVTVSPAAEDPNATKIDVLALYSQGADDLYVGEGTVRIEHLIAVSNQINNTSKVGMKIVPKSIVKYAMDDSASTYTVLDSITTDQTVAQMRQTAKADEVFIYRPIVESDGVCGLAWSNNDLNPAYAFAHMSVECPSDTTPHELGHNLGLAHDLRSDHGVAYGRVPYALGHYSPDNFVTVMTYIENYETEKIISVYSNPALDCGTEPCGIEAGEVGESDSVKAIQEIKNRVASFYIGDSDANLGDFTPPTVEGQDFYFNNVGYPVAGTVVATLVKNTDVISYVFKETGTTTSNDGLMINSNGEIIITQAGIENLKRAYTDEEGCSTTVFYNF